MAGPESSTGGGAGPGPSPAASATFRVSAALSPAIVGLGITEMGKVYGRSARLLADWRDARRRTAAALAEARPDRRLPWFGPPMKPTSMVTSRLMETWAHGQDVADALGGVRPPTARLRHVAHLAHATVGWSFQVRGETPPAAPVRFELTAPDGGLWVIGPAEAADLVTGPALDLCLLATQHRHPDDLDLSARGEAATAWLTAAQALAGAPGSGRRPGLYPGRRPGRRPEGSARPPSD